MLAARQNPLLAGPRTAAIHFGSAKMAARKLSTERSTTSKHRHTQRDARKAMAARKTLVAMPRPGYSLHLVHVGNCDGADLLATAFEITPGNCQHLRIATLSINDKSLNVLTRLIDSGRVKTITLLLSHYFRALDQRLYNRAHSELTGRACRVTVAQCHAKIWLMPMPAGAYTFEGSGNLRTCSSIEQLTITNDQHLAAFHAAWIDDLWEKHARRGDEKRKLTTTRPTIPPPAPSRSPPRPAIR